MPSKQALRQENRDLQAALDRSNNYLREADLRGIDQRFRDAGRATDAALAAADRAVTKSETASERRFEGINEFRGALNDVVSTMMPRAEASLRLDAIDARLGRIERGDREQAGERQGRTALTQTIRDNLGLVVAAIGAAGFFIGQHVH